MHRCLIVDDQEQNLYLFEMILKGNGYEVESAVNGAEALEKARRNPPDLIISDILMPVMDGFALCREWRKDDRLKTIPFIFYTATYTDTKDEAFGLSLGADRVLVKPLDPEVLIKEIAAVIRDKVGGTKASTGEEVPPEPVFLKEYNETLIRKLEDKMLRLERANQLLEEQIRHHSAVEEQLRQNERRISLIYDTVGDALYYLAADADGSYRFVSVNQAFYKVTGLKEKMIVGKLINEIIPEPNLSMILEKYRQAIEKKAIIRWEMIFVNPSRHFIGDVSIAPILDDKGHCTHLIGSVHDITEHKETEKHIRKLSLRQQALLAAIPDIIMEVDTNKIYTWANGPGIEFFGEDVIGKTAVFYFIREQNTYDAVQPIFNGSEDVIYLESWQRRKDGQERLLAWWCRVLKDTRGNVTGALSSARDITDHKLAEESLKEAELKFRTIFDFASDGILLARPGDKKFIAANKIMCEMLGYTEEELLRLGVPDIHEKESIPYNIDQFEKLYRKEILVAHNIPVMRKDKTVFFADVNASTITLEGKECLIGMFRDVTEYKREEESLRENERRLREAQEIAHLGFWTWDVKTGEVEWSNEVFRIFGLDPEEFTPHIDSIQALSPWPEDHQRDKEIINRAIENHNQGSYEQKFLRPDQSIGHYYSTFQGKYDENGNLITIVGTVLDITERKKAEEEIHKLNAELEQRVTERTTELMAKTSELERINKVFVDRELRMRELKERIAELEKKEK